MTANPKSTLGRGKSHKRFKICDEYCSSSPNFRQMAWILREKRGPAVTAFD